MNNLNFRITFPYIKFNDQLDGLSIEQRNIIKKHQHKFEGITYKDPSLSLKEGWDPIFKQRNDFFSYSLVYLITETIGEYPYPYFTEKTWKAMVNQRPFMLLGAPRSLELLRNMGFKTFADWWDEGYDLQENIGDRIDSIVKQLEILSKLTNKEILDLEDQMLQTVSHNLQHLVKFKEQDLRNIARLI